MTRSRLAAMSHSEAVERQCHSQPTSVGAQEPGSWPVWRDLATSPATSIVRKVTVARVARQARRRSRRQEVARGWREELARTVAQDQAMASRKQR